MLLLTTLWLAFGTMSGALDFTRQHVRLKGAEKEIVSMKGGIARMDSPIYFRTIRKNPLMVIVSQYYQRLRGKGQMSYAVAWAHR